MAADQSVALGATASYPLPGVMALVRVEPHVWAGNLEGCFRVGAIFLPDTSAPVAVSSNDKLTRTVYILTAVSLVVGTLATIATWGRR